MIMRNIVYFVIIVLLASCKTAKPVTETAVLPKKSIVVLKPDAVDAIKKNRAYDLGKRVLEACNTSRFKAFNTHEATPKVIANATAEKISATCQKIILRNGRFINLNLIEVTHNEKTNEYFFRYDIEYEKPLFKRMLMVTINSENKVSAILTKEIKAKPF
jgi:hypothetical protein